MEEENKPVVDVSKVIQGYQPMNQEKVNLFNKITSLGEEIERVILEVNMFNDTEKEASYKRGEIGVELRTRVPARWISMAETDFQVALMKLKRGLAKPTTF